MSQEYQRMQQLAGLLTEIRITPVIQQFKEFEKYPNWLYFNAPNGTEFEGSPMIDTDSQYVTPASSNSVMFEISLLHTNPKGYEGIQQMIDYLEKFNIKYNISNFNHNDFKDTYISVDLDDLKKQHLIKKVKKDINEVRIAASNFPRFTINTTSIDRNIPDWDQTPDDVRYVKYIDYHSPKSSIILRGHPQIYHRYVEPKNPNPIIIGVTLGDEQSELVFQELINYLRSSNIQYNTNRYEEDDEYAEVYLSVSLDDLKKKHLIKK